MIDAQGEEDLAALAALVLSQQQTQVQGLQALAQALRLLARALQSKGKKADELERLLKETNLLARQIPPATRRTE